MEDAEFESRHADIEERNTLELAVSEDRVLVAAGVDHEGFGAADALGMHEDEDGCCEGTEAEFVRVHHGMGATCAAPAMSHARLSGGDENVGSGLGAADQFPCLNGAVGLAEIVGAELALDAIVETALGGEDREDTLESEVVGCAEALPAREGEPGFSALGKVEAREHLIALRLLDLGEQGAQKRDLSGDGFDAVFLEVGFFAGHLFGGKLFYAESACADDTSDLVAHLAGERGFVFEQAEDAAAVELLNDLGDGIGEGVFERDAETLVLLFGGFPGNGDWHPAIGKRLGSGHVFLFPVRRDLSGATGIWLAL